MEVKVTENSAKEITSGRLIEILFCSLTLEIEILNFKKIKCLISYDVCMYVCVLCIFLNTMVIT